MKKLALFTLSLITLSAQAAPELTTYYCKMQKEPGQDAGYELRITETDDLVSGVHDARRQVLIETYRVTSSRTNLTGSFFAIGTYAGVEYEIDAREKNDFEFKMRLGEAGSPVVVTYDRSGVRSENSYSCDIE